MKTLTKRVKKLLQVMKVIRMIPSYRFSCYRVKTDFPVENDQRISIYGYSCIVQFVYRTLTGCEITFSCILLVVFHKFASRQCCTSCLAPHTCLPWDRNADLMEDKSDFTVQVNYLWTHGEVTAPTICVTRATRVLECFSFIQAPCKLKGRTIVALNSPTMISTPHLLTMWEKFMHTMCAVPFYTQSVYVYK